MTEFTKTRPGGAIAARPLHLIWIADCSGSMNIDGKIHALNDSIIKAIPAMREGALENPHAKVLIRAVRFGDLAQWHVAVPTPVEDFQWPVLRAGGYTQLGLALQLVAEQLKIPFMSERALPPVLVLISDGKATDDADTALKKLLDLPWGKKAVRLAIAIGQEVDMQFLNRFIADPGIKPLTVNNHRQLQKYIKWVSTVVIKSVSTPATTFAWSPSGTQNVVIPAPTEILETLDPVW